MPESSQQKAGCGPACIVDTSIHCSYDALTALPQFEDCSGKTSFSPIDVACGLCQLGGIPVFKAGKYIQGLGSLAATGLEMLNMNDPRSAEGAIKKALAYKTWTSTVTQNKLGVVFGEEQLEYPETKVFADVTANATFVVDNVAGFAVGMKIMILTDDGDSETSCCDTIIRRTITAINTDTKAITVNAVVTVKADDDVIALWIPIAACALPKEGGFSSKTEYFTSYFQRFGRLISFDSDDANKCDCSFDMANRIVDHKLREAYNGLADDMLKAKYLAQNISDVETMGFLPTVQYAETQYGVKNIHSMKNVKTPVAKISLLYTIFSQAQRAGREVGDLWVPMTQVAYDQLRMAGPAFHQLRGCMPVCSNDSTFQFETFDIKNLGKTIHFYHDPFLDRMFPNRSIMLFHHEDSFNIVAPKYISNVNMQTKSYEQMVDMFKMEEVNPSANAGKVDCDRQFSIWTKLAYVRLGARFGAMGIIEGF